MNFNVFIFLQSLVALACVIGAALSIEVVMRHRWLPLRLVALVVTIVLVACLLALLVP